MKHRKRNFLLSLVLCMALLLGQVMPAVWSYAESDITVQAGETEKIQLNEEKETNPSIEINESKSEKEGINEGTNSETDTKDGSITKNNESKVDSEKKEESTAEEGLKENTDTTSSSIDTTVTTGSAVGEDKNTTDSSINTETEPTESKDTLNELLEDKVVEPIMEVLEEVLGGPVNIKNYDANSKSKEYFIEDTEGLKKLGELVNSGTSFEGKSISVTKEINLQNEEWIPIGTAANPFGGVFDGGDKKITNLKIETSSLEYIGLFGYIKKATIQNVKTEKGSIEGNTSEKNLYAGGLAGCAEESKFSNCSNAVSIMTLNSITDAQKNETHTGGLVGYVEKSNFTDCSNDGNITSASEAKKNLIHKGGTGGIAGSAEEGSFLNCKNAGKIDGGWSNENFQNYPSGGILGQAKDVTLTGCQNNGKVKIKGWWVGGILGRGQTLQGKNVSITNCQNNGEIEINGQYVGGVIGIAEASEDKIIFITDCQNNGEIEVTNGQYIGGVIGQGQAVQIKSCRNLKEINGKTKIGGFGGELQNSSIKDCSNEGNISASNFRAGGIVAYAQQTEILQCKNIGMIEAVKYAGGVVGELSNCPNISNNYNIGSISASKQYAGGIAGKSASSIVTSCYNWGKIDSMNSKGGIVTDNNTTVIHCYFLDTCIANPVDTKYAIGKDEISFSNGEVAYLLNTQADGSHSDIWGQAKEYPVFADNEHPVVCKAVLKINKAEEQTTGGSIMLENSTESEQYLVKKDLTVKVKPDEGYILKLLSLNDGNGNKINKSREDQGDGSIIFTFKNPGKDISAEATFEKKGENAPDELNVVWSLNGGTVTKGTMPERIKYGAVLKEPSVEKKGYTLMGWYVGENPQPEKEQSYDFDSVVTGNLTLTAIWCEDALYVTFDPNYDGAESEEPTRFAFGGKFQLKEISRPTPEGMEYKMLGWYTEKQDKETGKVKGTKWEKDQEITQRGRITLYAAWELVDSFNNGTEENPFIINDAETLKLLAERVNSGNVSGYKGKYFKLGKDIDLKEIPSWTPIGTQEHPFQGNFNGDYHTITNLKIHEPEKDNQGLFGYVSYTTREPSVRNLYLEDVTVIGKCNVGGIIGGIFGCGSSEFKSLGVKSGKISGTAKVGGIIGSIMLNPEYTRSGDYCLMFNAANITASNGEAGGIVGNVNTQNSLSYCYNTGKISGANAGAITGKGYTGNTNCYYLDESIAEPVDKINAEAKNALFFKSGEAAYNLDCGNNSQRTEYWSQGESFPIFADSENKAVYKLSMTQGENGTITISGLNDKSFRYVKANTKVDVTVSAEKNCILKQLKVTEFKSGKAVETQGTGAGTVEIYFNMPTADVNILSIFAPKGEGNVNIKYDLDGGDWEDYPDPSAQIPFGTVLKQPSVNPQKTGYDFRGWYVGNQKYNFSEAVTEDVTLTAKWSTHGKFIVSFNLNHEGWSKEQIPEQFKDQEIEPNGKVNKPENPKWVYKDKHTAYKFCGWYTEPVGGKVWDFSNNIIKEDTVLYAQWKEVDAMSAGTLSEPCIIDSVEMLQYLAECVNEGNSYKGCYFCLKSDLDLKDIPSWTPIGTASAPFSGHFDGNGHVIQNLTISAKTDYAGLFGNISFAEVKNLTLNEVQIEGGNYVGGIAGMAGQSCGKVLQVNNLSSLKVSGTIIGISQVGGIAGTTGESNFLGSTFSGTVTGTDQVGGIAGETYGGNFNDCKVSGSIKGEDKVGGISGKISFYENKQQQGENYGANIENCSNEANVAGSNYVGGLAGYGQDIISVQKVYNQGTISGEDLTGGLLGGLSQGAVDEKEFIVSLCYNTGKVKSTASEAKGIGGLIGVQENPGKIKVKDSYNAGIMETPSTVNVGGIAGTNFKNITNCYYLTSGKSFADAAYSKAMKLEDFESGRAAYLMDGGTGVHSNVWGQGIEHPVFADETHPSVYEISLSVTGAGIVSGAGLEKGLNYKSFKGEQTIEVKPLGNHIISLFEVVDTAGKVLYSGSGKEILNYQLPSGKSMNIHAAFAEKADKKFTVTFDFRGGKIDNQEMLKKTEIPFGTKALELKPHESPIKEIEGKQYAFVGWYIDADLNTAFNFDTLITEDTTIYAKYKEKTTIRFNLNGPKAGDGASTTPPEQKLIIGDKVTKPENPTWGSTKDQNDIEQSHVFLGWSTDPVRWMEWNFNEPLKEEDEGKTITLYAHWKTTYNIEDEKLKDITDAGLFEKLSENVRNGESYLGKKLNLGEDITLDGWTRSIGSQSCPFEGSFDGNGHTIMVKDGNMPLFGYIGQSGSLNNVTVSGNMMAKDTDTFGGLVNTNKGVIKSCHARNLTIEGGNAEAVGGIAGETIGYLKDCTVDESSRISGHNAVGGVTGSINLDNASISGCKNAGEVISENGVAGGIIGSNKKDWNGHASQIQNSSNSGKIQGDQQAGGIVGMIIIPLTLDNCKNTGNISSEHGDSGGIVGFFKGRNNTPGQRSILFCENSGEVAGYKNVGGITGGISEGHILIDHCKNNGKIIGSGSVAVAGGMLGIAEDERLVTISECINMGEVVSTGSYAAGILGRKVDTGGKISKCSNTGAVTCNGTACGIAGVGLEKIENCYSVAMLTGSTTYGICSNYDRADTPTTIENCYWYNKDSKVDGLCNNATGVTLKNSYYYSTEIVRSRTLGLLGSLMGTEEVLSERGVSLSAENPEPMAQPEKAFTGGKIAYLLDGGNNMPHKNVWTQGDLYPTFGKGNDSVYKVTISSRTGGTASIKGEMETAYLVQGKAVAVTVTPNAATETAKYELDSLSLDGNGKGTISESNLTLGDGNAVLTANFKMVGVKPEPKPEPKPDNQSGKGGHGKGSGTGNGNGNDDFGKTGEGGGTGDGIGKGSDSGDHEGAHETGDKTTVTNPTAMTQSEGKTPENVLMVQQDEQNQIEKEEVIQASGGSTEGGSIGNEKEKEKVKLTIFEIVKKTAQENPWLIVMFVAIIVMILAFGAIGRYKNYRKDN
ncbi:InlB B-repeat-containing protein [Aminipila sp.]|uniref:InlB B-repeat-containing protein n=1 Tax=Aminipila sp. TaxID=2060095 RepID=UPI0028A16272|nr:InlB B-repeat-containing protein [Aminipila sp.]